jgi:hypothetical protein
MALSTLAMSNSTPSIQSRLRHVAQGSPSPDSEINANFKAIIEKQKASIADLEKNLRDVKSSSREAEIDARDSVDNNIELGCKIKRLEYTVTIKQREISSLLNRLSDAELLSTETQSTLNESNDRVTILESAIARKESLIQTLTAELQKVNVEVDVQSFVNQIKQSEIHRLSRTGYNSNTNNKHLNITQALKKIDDLNVVNEKLRASISRLQQNALFCDSLTIVSIKEIVADLVDMDRISLIRMLAKAMSNGYPKLGHISFDFLRYQLKFWSSDPEKQWTGNAALTGSVQLDQYHFQQYSKLKARGYEYSRGNGYIGCDNKRYLDNFDGVFQGSSSRTMQRTANKAHIKCGINNDQLDECAKIAVEFQKNTPNALTFSVNTDGADFGAETLHRHKHTGKILGAIDFNGCLETLEFDEEVDKPVEVQEVESELRDVEEFLRDLKRDVVSSRVGKEQWTPFQVAIVSLSEYSDKLDDFNDTSKSALVEVRTTISKKKRDAVKKTGKVHANALNSIQQYQCIQFGCWNSRQVSERKRNSR